MSEMKRRNLKLKNKKIDQQIELESDENFAFIVGYTSGGAAYGVTHQEMAELESEIEIQPYSKNSK
jgi:hypothetical protein